jgi:hypothetical protein
MKLLIVSKNTQRWRTPMRAAYLVTAGLLAFAACTPDYADDGRSPVMLRIIRVTAGAGGSGTGGAFLLSDVRDDEGNGVFNDDVILTVQNVPKNQNDGTVYTRLQDVVLERYEVRYIRSDGRDVEGVDVPFSISGDVTAVIPVEDPGVPVTFIVVRHQAKREPPLANIQAGGANLSGGARAMTVFAKIIVYGRTIAGQAVKSNEATLEIGFGDFFGTQ